MVDYSTLVIYGLIIVLMMVVVICKKEVSFGLKRWFLTMKYKGNIGYHFRVNAGGDMQFPEIVDLSKEIAETDTEIVPIINQQFQGPTFLKTKFLITDRDNILMSYGLYKHDCDEHGKPKYHSFNLGEDKVLETKIPVLIAGKTSCTVSGDLIKKTFLSAGLSSAVDDFIKKNKILLILCGGAILVGVISAYFGYINNNLNAQVLASLAQLKGQVGTLAVNITGVA